MSVYGVSFSIVSEAAWAPGLTTPEDWLAWAADPARPPVPVVSPEMAKEPGLSAMPSMLRRRTGVLGKMALEVAYQCLAERGAISTVFCSRHGEVSRLNDLLLDLSQGAPLSPTSFGMSVHNAIGGLFSIARGDRANNTALAAGPDSIEHAVIEACGLLADGEPLVLLVACDLPLPEPYAAYQDCVEQPHAFAWLMGPPKRAGVSDVSAQESVEAEGETLSLHWSETGGTQASRAYQPCAGLDVLRFQLRRDSVLERVGASRLWHWSRGD